MACRGCRRSWLAAEINQFFRPVHSRPAPWLRGSSASAWRSRLMRHLLLHKTPCAPGVAGEYGAIQQQQRQQIRTFVRKVMQRAQQHGQVDARHEGREHLRHRRQKSGGRCHHAEQHQIDQQAQLAMAFAPGKCEHADPEQAIDQRGQRQLPLPCGQCGLQSWRLPVARRPPLAMQRAAEQQNPVP